MHRAPYGSWTSPIDAAMVAAHDGKPEYLGAVGDELWWTEPRPAEGGRRALLRLLPDAEAPVSVLPEPWNVRSRLVEYGGVPWAATPRASGGPLVVFAHFADQRLRAFEPDAPGGAQPRPLTPLSPVGGGLRFGDLAVEGDEVWCVLEEFTGEGPGDVRRVPVAVPLDGSAAEDRSALRELTDERHRFVTTPRLSPDGRRAVWLGWDHPRMPWDGTELLLADVTEGPGGRRLTGVRVLAGGPAESVAQAEWTPDGALLAVSDRGGWWNPYRLDPATGEAVALCPREEEFADALWHIGYRWFAPLADGTVAVLHGRGEARLGVLDPATGDLADVPGPWTEWSPTLAVHGTRVTGIAAGPGRHHEIVRLDTSTGHCVVVARAHRDAVDPAYLPQPRAVTVTREDGAEVHAQVYPPRHPDAAGEDGTRPPYVIRAHGGPTSRAPLVLDLEIAYFTSRGIGVAEVNYGGSTGHGRAYRERLRGAWGVVDVEDCAAVAAALAAEGAADPARLAVRGGSAGGWTTAASLAAPALAGRYACGAISYPVLDLTAWAQDETHDFESHYLESLVGPLAEVPERYRDRSPAGHADRVTAPFLLLQGLDDVICPPAQAERFVAEAAVHGVPHAYLTFEGEGHGFRAEATIRRALEAELGLYLTVFGVTRPDVPPLVLRGGTPEGVNPPTPAAP
ncbi:prolyl oligopeptidase family serine peptidase [Streptomyces avicenniae]|uniref:prolyl oligopeptidase family serine peptidase n=1 Tax=Streptomyces avicenniae TaxID=500153 RepID=UPI00069B79E2|nr:prolyl oligopeptidase family serine peptidase [Streptomyces avicenniae]